MEPLVGDAKTKQALRRDLQAARRRLAGSERARLDLLICGHLLHVLEQRAGGAVAAYHACGGEPDLAPALLALDRTGYRVHLPVLQGQVLQFRRWTPGALLMPNRYGIPEPLDGLAGAAEELDWVLLPLVGFSPAGARLGMGGGYYDRTFAFCLQRPMGSRPSLIGVAYGLQQVDSLPMQPWDVPLDGVVTDRGMRWFSSEPR
jgi:5-formyltetrahydrofolate cyclo-ligase